MRRTLVLVTVLAGVLPSLRARAETVGPPVLDASPPCSSPAPEPAVTLPANAPGIAVRGRVTGVSLMAPDGTSIAATASGVRSDGFSIVTWSTVLSPGSAYLLRWTDECAAPRVWKLVAAETKPLPTKAGTVSVTPRTVSLLCDAEGRASGLVPGDVILNPSAELAPFLGIVATEVVAKPTPSGSSGMSFGSAGTGLAGTVSLRCPGSLREVQVSVVVSIPNGPVLTTDPVTASLPCPTTCWDGPGTAPGFDASSTVDGGSGDAGLSETPLPDAQGGGIQCATATGASAPAALTFATFALAALGHVARRRRGPRR